MIYFDFLWGPYGLFGLVVLCAALLLVFQRLPQEKSVEAGDTGSLEEEVLDRYSVMGKAKPDFGVAEVSADEFGFSGETGLDEEEMLTAAKTEIRVLCQVLADKDGTKEDFFSMFGLIREGYPGIAALPMRSSIDEFIREQVPFFLSVAELESLWD
ncbi:hypothetical protein [Pedobacter aquatilis]|uniref:hypothetical protein n=1 Tax=Pedobacter aquatilis TaxID=351343 RepID=UPI00292CC68C|nr:hypothetical protein [Pedobacter aquatilis]